LRFYALSVIRRKLEFIAKACEKFEAITALERQL